MHTPGQRALKQMNFTCPPASLNFFFLFVVPLSLIHTVRVKISGLRGDIVFKGGTYIVEKEVFIHTSDATIYLYP